MPPLHCARAYLPALPNSLLLGTLLRKLLRMFYSRLLALVETGEVVRACGVVECNLFDEMLGEFTALRQRCHCDQI